MPQRHPGQSSTPRVHDYFDTARVKQARHPFIARELTNLESTVNKEITVGPPFLLLSSTVHEIREYLFSGKSEIQIRENLVLRKTKIENPRN